MLDRSTPCHLAPLHNFVLSILVLPRQLSLSSILTVFLFLLVCQPTQIDAESMIQRLNNGVVFTEHVSVYIAAELWLHTFELEIPRRSNFPQLGTCHRDNNTGLLVSQLLSQINLLRAETALRLNNTINTVHRLVPKAQMQEYRRTHSFACIKFLIRCRN